MHTSSPISRRWFAGVLFSALSAVAMAQDALELLRENIYDCMIIDLKLPDMLGNELLKRMTAEDIRSFPPVIVYTGRNLTREEEADLLKYSRSIIIKGARSPERLLDEVTLFLHKVESQLSHERQRMLKTARSRDKVFEGRKVLLGIRPEHINHHVHQSDFIASLPVAAFEMTGSEVLAEFEFNGQPLRAKLDAQVEMRNGDVHELHFDMRNISLFCAATEIRI